jgi:hypothetical protein
MPSFGSAIKRAQGKREASREGGAPPLERRRALASRCGVPVLDRISADGLRPLTVFFPDKSLRWIADACRAKRIPNAVKVGKTWMVRPSDFERWITRAQDRARAPAPSIEEATAELRRRGLL